MQEFEIEFDITPNEFEIDISDKVKEIFPPLENLEVTPTKEQQVFNHENSYGYDNVTVEPIPDEYIIPDGTLDVNANGDVDVTMFRMARVGVYTPPTLQDKEVTPTKEIQSITADTDYDGLGNVTVNAIPDEYIVPNGTLEITENGTHDVTGYKEATVNVEGGEVVVEPDYITDGLIAWFDGEDGPNMNIRPTSHPAGVWKSRVGEDFIYDYNNVTNADRFFHLKAPQGYMNNMKYFLKTETDYFVQGYTIELVGVIKEQCTSNNPTSTSSGCSLLAFNRSSSPIIQVNGDNGQFRCINSNAVTYPIQYTGCKGKRYKYAICLDEIPGRSSSSGYHTISYALNNSNWSTASQIYLNVSIIGNGTVFLCYYDKSYASCGEINCIRVYNRKLTEEELAHNYEIDKARFNLDEYS